LTILRSGAAEFPHTPFRRALAPAAAVSEKNATGFRILQKQKIIIIFCFAKCAAPKTTLKNEL
jgi:hypothetical protein